MKYKDKISKAIFIRIPMSFCNFRCQYCYLSQRENTHNERQIEYQYSPKHVAKALSKERLGGVSYINICADGETLIAKDIEKYIYELLKEGHYIEIVTNLSITSILDRMLKWDRKLLSHLEFKCSFHYLELKEKKLLNVFAENVNKIWDAGASANIEITPHDELIPFIPEVIKFSQVNFGALPHISIARNDAEKDIGYLTKLSLNKYYKIWGQFYSQFWEFKKTLFKVKRREFCYAGAWSLYIDLTTGVAQQCYNSWFNQNIFSNIDKQIEFIPVGKCNLAHCYNGHAFLTLGCIPNFTTLGYGDIRDRVKSDGSSWLQPGLKKFFNTKLQESNITLSLFERTKIKNKARVIFYVQKIRLKYTRFKKKMKR